MVAVWLMGEGVIGRCPGGMPGHFFLVGFLDSRLRGNDAAAGVCASVGFWIPTFVGMTVSRRYQWEGKGRGWDT